MHTYLDEGQTLFPIARTQPVQVKVIEGTAQRRRLRRLAQDLHHAGGYESAAPFNITVIPIVVHFPAQADHVTGFHSELSGSIGLKVVQGFSQHLEKQTQIREIRRINEGQEKKQTVVYYKKSTLVRKIL